MKYFLTHLFLTCSFFINAQDSTVSDNDTLVCGDATIIFNTRCEEILPGISFVHVHEDETTALRAANWLLDSTQKSCFVTWQCQQQRYINFRLSDTRFRFDPNRIYTTAGLATTLKNELGLYSDQATNVVKLVADSFLKKYINGKMLVVALHNNTNAGGLTVNSYKKTGAYAKDAQAVFIDSKQDADDFFYTTEPAFFNFMKSKGFNVVLQNNLSVKDDGSLSVYCAGERIPYINIEAQEGHLQQQKKMLAAVWEIIKAMPSPEFYQKTETY